MSYTGNPAIFPSDETIAKLEAQIYTGEARQRLIDEAWTRINARLKRLRGGRAVALKDFRRRRGMDDWRQAQACVSGDLAPAGPVAGGAVPRFRSPSSGALSFGEKVGAIGIDITGTLANYQRALEPLYLLIFAKSFWLAALTTLHLPRGRRFRSRSPSASRRPALEGRGCCCSSCCPSGPTC